MYIIDRMMQEMMEAANKAVFIEKKRVKVQEYKHLNRKAVISKKHNLVRGTRK